MTLFISLSSVLCIDKNRANKFSLATIQLVGSGFSTTGSESAFILFDRTDPASPGNLNSLQERREQQMLESFDRDCGTLRLGLKDRALQRRNQEAASSSQSLLVIGRRFHSRSQTIRDRLAHLLEDLNYPLPDHFAVLACFGAEVADETSVSPTVALKIVDLRIEEGSQALKRRKRVIAKSLIDHRACAFVSAARHIREALWHTQLFSLLFLILLPVD
jgi:hypothetical protein